MRVLPQGPRIDMTTPEPSEAAIFNSARRIHAPEDRDAYLDRVCGDDRGLRTRVEALLRIHDEEPTFLQSPAEEFDEPVGEGPGTVLGPYTLLEQIGEGGFGVVFMAEQEHPIRRKVALKVIKPGMDTRQVVARFEAERQALALMDHPNIARVFDGGETPAGRPYFVMELVRGVPVTDFCDQNHMTVRQRLELFVSVCQAVQHAHQKGIIHRDLKPTNVLVTLHDGTPVPKVIDFGIAKATGQKLTEKSLFTGFAQMVGTPIYMSPEQAEMSGLDVDTRADIYALGVLLYELLTGTTPFDPERLRTAGFDEVRRIIREEEPARPSARVSTLGRAAATVTTNRGSDPKHLGRLIRGELDWIVMKCLEKDRTRRYESASALARDIERYLADEPVDACPPSPAYRLRKFLRRNRVPAVAASLVVLTLLAGIAGTTLGLVEARRQAGLAWSAQANESEARVRETQRAESEAAERVRTAEAEAEARKQEKEAKEQLALSSSVIDFLLNDLLAQAASRAQADRGFEPKPNLTVREALDRAAAAIGDRFKDRPRLEAMVRQTLGNSYRQLGEYDKAIAQIRQAADIRERALGADHVDTLSARHSLAVAYRAKRQLDDAIRLFDQVYRARTASLGPEHPDTLKTLNGLASAHLDAGNLDQAEALFRQVYDARLKTLGPENPYTITALHNLADAYQRNDKPAKAVEIFERIRAIDLRDRRPDHPEALSTLNNLALSYWRMNRYDKSVPLLEELLAATKKVQGDGHPHVLHVQANLGVNYCDAGYLREGIRLLEEVHRDGGKYPDLRWVDLQLVLAYVRAGRAAQARPLAPPIELEARHKPPPGGLGLASVLSLLGSVSADQGEWVDAEAKLRECLSIRESKEPDAWTTFNTQSRLGGVLLGRKMYKEAEPFLRQGLAGMKERESRMDVGDRFNLKLALERLVHLYDAWGKKPEADRWRKELEAENAVGKK
ncbi:MAG: tetratricopeptide repeat protein [Zavarzinella sp.]|nr:tetratricopeptide repeat protein [Zavarzinella sp.]